MVCIMWLTWNCIVPTLGASATQFTRDSNQGFGFKQYLYPISHCKYLDEYTNLG